MIGKRIEKVENATPRKIIRPIQLFLLNMFFYYKVKHQTDMRKGGKGTPTRKTQFFSAKAANKRKDLPLFLSVLATHPPGEPENDGKQCFPLRSLRFCAEVFSQWGFAAFALSQGVFPDEAPSCARFPPSPPPPS